MKTVLNQTNHEVTPEIVSVIPTIDVVIFPNAIVPLLVLDEKVINGINIALEQSKMILLLAAKVNANFDHQGTIETEDLYRVGTVASIMRVIKIPEGGIKILVQGVYRAEVESISTEKNTLQARIKRNDIDQGSPHETTPIVRSIKETAEKISTSGGYTFSPDFHLILSKMHDIEKIADFVLSNISISVQEAQELLESKSLKILLQQLYRYLYREIETAEIQEKIRNNARDSINQSQKEFFLREQLKAIKQELGEDDLEEIEEMRDKLSMIELPDDTKQEVARQINRLERTAPDSLEATVTRNYLEWIFAMPWNQDTEDNLDLDRAKQILDEDHYGLKDVKDRILDFISIKNLKKDGYAPILCFVGPPGTGKTSLGKSIAKSLGRTYARISLGGVKDEAEIRGHRRTYVGAMPGRFIQAIKKAGSCNPLIVIDELDKIGADFRGDPSAAMLEVLDPQQNQTFYDNYLGIPFDLSKIMFIATANDIESISGPLRDRLEVIELSGYTVEEKVNIAQSHLVQRAVTDTGLETYDLDINSDVIKKLISDYTRESGIRQLERLLRKLCSKMARIIVENKKEAKDKQQISLDDVPVYLGPSKFLHEVANKQSRVGISNGLAWTPHGGEMVNIEAMTLPGTGKLLLTGQLGDVMKESAQAALSYARAQAKTFDISDDLFSKHDLHIHIPAGAVPKDGPSAGITMLTAILSALTKRPINAQYAMTGELNLRGEIMPIGGVKEKILAAIRNNIAHVIIPDQNKNELPTLEDIAQNINIIWVKHADEVLDKVLMSDQAE